MKLESGLDDNPPSIFLAGAVDVVLILLIFFLLGSSLVVRSGMSVRLPSSSSGLQQFSDAHVITITAGAAPILFLDGRAVPLAELDARLTALDPRKPSVMLRADQLATYGLVTEVSDIVLRRGFDLAHATSTVGSGEEAP